MKDFTYKQVLWQLLVQVSRSVRFQMGNQLIIQFKPKDFSDPYNSLIEIEETLIQAFSQNYYAEVDGHDIGKNEMNIFIFPKGSWEPVIERVIAFLKLKKVLNKAIIAKKFRKSEKYEVVYPENYEKEFMIG